MPGRHVFNHEFEIHHKIFQAGIPFIEDFKDLGQISKKDVFLAAVPLKMTCIDGAPMRAVVIDWKQSWLALQTSLIRGHICFLL